jgi:hypothetical protein
MPELPDFDEIMKMAQNAQNELQKAQDNLDKIEVEGVAGGGMVKIHATAKGRILSVDIDESLLAPSEKTMVEDLVAAAFRNIRKRTCDFIYHSPRGNERECSFAKWRCFLLP